MGYAYDTAAEMFDRLKRARREDWDEPRYSNQEELDAFRAERCATPIGQELVEQFEAEARALRRRAAIQRYQNGRSRIVVARVTVK